MPWGQVMEEAAALGGAWRARKRYVGVWQRPSGWWVAEIKDTIQKIRVWLGTYDTAEEAAKAYDEAACLLRGANTRTKFWPASPFSNSKPSLPSNITNLLLNRLKARKANVSPSTAATASSSPAVTLQEQEDGKIEETQFDNFFDFPGDCNNVFENRETNGYFEWNNSSMSEVGGEKREEMKKEEVIGMGLINFQIKDGEESCNRCSPFEITQEMMEQDSSYYYQYFYGDHHEHSMVREIIRRMKYERKLSASLYAYNGVSECLRLKLGSNGCDKMPSNLEVNINNNGDQKMEINGIPHTTADHYIHQVGSGLSSSSSSSSKENGDQLSLRISIDLPPICVIAYN